MPDKFALKILKKKGEREPREISNIKLQNLHLEEVLVMQPPNPISQ